MGLLVTLLLAVLFISAKAGPLRPINSVSAPPSEPSNSKKVPSDFDASVDGIDNSRTSVTSSEVSTAVSTDADVQALMEKYKGRFLRCEVPGQPQCDLFLCGTLHVSRTSVDMVKEVIQTVRPSYVVVEVCDARIDGLCASDPDPADMAIAMNITLSGILKSTLLNKEHRSIKVFGAEVLGWMQVKAAKVMGNKLGGELAMAAHTGAEQGAMIILGDRAYSVTIQRCFDKLRVLEKIKLLVLMLWEVMSMSVGRMKDYIQRTEKDEQFIKDEIAKFGKHLPTFANIIVHERDEYLATTLCEVARVGFLHPQSRPKEGEKGRVVAVVGAAHLSGISKWIQKGGVGEERIAEISSSSKSDGSTWPGKGNLQVVNTRELYPHLYGQSIAF